ncbi:MAG: cytochrome c [Melioribacteraceae bacterium]|nr:cytochrome c [Melioribacteraceae bacterium]
MTNAQKWVAAFLFLFVILFALSRITKEDASSDFDFDFYGEEEQSQTSSSELNGLTLAQRIGCSSCHGVDLKGTNQAPTLVNIKDHWNRTELINYLRNPSSYGNDQRFIDYKNQYPNVIMPAYEKVDIKELGAIADYILSLEN